MVGASKKWHHLRAVFHLQITFVEVGSSVSTTHHVLFFVTLVLAIGSIVNGTLLQIHFFYGCLKRKSLSYHVSKTDITHTKKSYSYEQNYNKTSSFYVQFWHFPPIFVLLKVTCLVTLFDHKLQVFLKLAEIDYFWHF